MTNQKFSKGQNLWVEKLMAIIATLNLGLVLFDLSYIPWRDFYLRRLPQLTQIYDPFKGIETHRETQNYLNAIQTLEDQVSQAGLQSPQVKTKLLEIIGLSTEMIDSNPFTAAGKSGTLEKIKNRMRMRTRQKSAKEAFATFWSQEYLSKQGWKQEIDFFNSEIKPFIATNYYRQIGENGELKDNFWEIDSPFIALFAVELLFRTIYIRRRRPELSWTEAVLWRWYDLFLLLPFWQWLRIIPVTVRLDQSQLIDLLAVRRQMQQGLVANFAEEITEIVVVRVINQIQGSIQRGELTRWLLQKDSLRPYIDINNVNEVEAIAGIFVQTIVYQVFPKIQPEIVAILRHNIDSALSQTPVYRNLQMLPGVGQMQSQLSEQLVTQITTNLYSALVSTVEDPVAGKLSSQLVQKFTDALGAEMQKKHLLLEVQSLLFDFLEEVKLNYVQRLSQEDMQQILEQTRQLRTNASVSSITKA
jgi:hypothetical protein